MINASGMAQLHTGKPKPPRHEKNKARCTVIFQLKTVLEYDSEIGQGGASTLDDEMNQKMHEMNQKMHQGPKNKTARRSCF